MFPNMQDAFLDWQTRSTFSVVTKSLSNYQVSESKGAETSFDGLLYPQSAQQLAIKPEGQRTWKWWALISSKALALDTVIKDASSKEFRVMSVRDFSMAGFYEYDLVENYANPSA